jgi:hypothetical protein
MTAEERAAYDASVRSNMTNPNFGSLKPVAVYPNTPNQVLTTGGNLPVSKEEETLRPLSLMNLGDEAKVAEPIKGIDPASVGFSPSDAVPISGLQNIGGEERTGVTAQAPENVAPMFETAASAGRQSEEKLSEVATAGRIDPPRASDDASGRTSQGTEGPRGGGRHGPETQDAQPGSGGSGNAGRCFI